MKPEQLETYTRLVEFLGNVLGPDYEIVLQDVTRRQPCVVAIANGQISGRTVGAPLTNVAMQAIADRSYLAENWKLNYQGISANGRLLRCSTYYIKDSDGTLEGLLCINFDDSRYRELSSKLYSLCSPDAAGSSSMFFRLGSADNPTLADAAPEGGDLTADGGRESGDSERFYTSIESAVSETLRSVLGGMDVAPEHLSRQEKLRIVRLLNDRGIFMLKGAIPIVSKALSCSQATIYRYLSQVRSGEDSTSHGGK